MSEKNFPKSHGRFGHEEMGKDFTNQGEIFDGPKINIVQKLFKKKKQKANEVARQNLE
ncbi:hypothetical protein [Rummeliibacillus pycnus]|uniref:hypothetical protein n=1 Tax=Rummeliibacillus pycnus TaxID=101070 RepID=UPI001474A906|nr:hypothetical protein [Rummeliibacillus pycnus]